MPSLIVTSPLRRDGKSTVAAGVAGALARETAAGLTIVEAPDPAAVATAAAADPRRLVLLVSRYGQADDATIVRTAGETSAAGIVFTAVPADRLEAARSRVDDLGSHLDAELLFLGAMPQDRLLAAPSVREMAQALSGTLHAPDELRDEALEWIEIGPITAHPGSVHFARLGSKAVITRVDRPDLALAALDTETACLILTGGQAPLSYVLERTQSEEIPLISTPLSTPDAVERLGPLYGRSAFVGRRKAERAVELARGHLDLSTLERLLAVTERVGG